MLPAIIISMLLGTGPNATMTMVLLLPLEQSAVSSAVDKPWGSPGHSQKHKQRTRKEPLGRTASRTYPNKRTREGTKGELPILSISK
ncbi:hypothetical protein Ancab_024443 [Ancistrocladus abbreviatus]